MKTMSRRWMNIFLLDFAFLSAVALGQVNTASLTGLVKDPSDAVIGDAAVKARNTATGVERAVLTNSSGYYLLANLPVGTYDI